MSTLNDLIHKLESARRSLELDSDSWRDHLKGAIEQAEDGGSNLLSRDLHQVAGYAISDLGIELRCNWSFAKKSISQALTNLINALKEKQAQLERTKSLEGTAQDLLNAIVVDTKLPPFICSSVQQSILLERQADGSLQPRRNEHVISYNGFGFDSLFDGFRVEIRIAGNSGERTVSHPDKLVSLQKFRLGLNLTNIKFRSGDEKLTLAISGEPHQLPIVIRSKDPGPLTKDVVISHHDSLRIVPMHYKSSAKMPLFGFPVLTAKEFESVVATRTMSHFGPRGVKLHGTWYYGYKFYDHRAPILQSLAAFESTRRVWIPVGGDSKFAGNGPLISVDVHATHRPDAVQVTANLVAAEWRGRLPYGDFTLGKGSVSKTLPLPASLASDWDVVEILSASRSQDTILSRGKSERLTIQRGLIKSLDLSGERLDDSAGTAKRYACTLSLGEIRVKLARKGQYQLVRGPGGRVNVLPLD